MKDTIYRQDAIDRLCKQCNLVSEYAEPCTEKCNNINILEMMPSALPDLSEYSDKLWRAAYERGMQKAQLDIVYCRECIHWRYDTDHTCRYYGGASPRLAIDFCSKGERREE